MIKNQYKYTVTTLLLKLKNSIFSKIEHLSLNKNEKTKTAANETARGAPKIVGACCEQFRKSYRYQKAILVEHFGLFIA